MKNNFFLFFIWYLFFSWMPAFSQPPLVNSVNLITGKATDSTYDYEYYVEGINESGETCLRLEKGDSRIGRVKLQKQQSSRVASFFYYAGYTEVIDRTNHKSIYRYSKHHQIEAVEQYTSLGERYRTERLFWDLSNKDSPKLVSRVIEDGSGQAHLACLSTYNKKGQLIKETLVGNLTGTCTAPLIMDSKGGLENNGIESYSTTYEYDPQHPELLIKHKEDNGSMILYGYHPQTKECTSKLKGDGNGIISRCFYFFDSQGFLSRTVLDDGHHHLCDDLTGVTARQIIDTQICQQGPAIGQPLVVESKFVDLANGQEVALEKVIHHYSSTGLLIQKDFFDDHCQLRYSVNFEYDDKGVLIATIDSRGNKVENTAPEAPNNRYNEGQQCEASIDKYGNETQFFYDDFGRLTKTRYPSILNDQDQPWHPEIVQTYDIFNRPVLIKDANGNLTSTTYNARGKPIQIKYPNGAQENIIYFLDGSLKSNIAKDGRKTLFQRDAFGRVTRTEEWMDRTLLGCLNYTYKGAFLISVTDKKTFTTHFQYDGIGRQIAVLHTTKEGTKRREWAYDVCGKKTNVKEWFGSADDEFVTKIEEKDSEQNSIGVRLEDATGATQKKIDVLQTEDSLFSQTLCTLNAQQQYVQQQENVDASGKRRLITYDAMGRIEEVVVFDPLGNKLSETHTRHDGNGNKILERHVVLIKGNPTHTFTLAWSYDSLNQLIQLQERSDLGVSKTTQYVYNACGQLEALIKPDGIRISYCHDEIGRISALKASDGSIHYCYIYDAQHRLIAVDDLINSQRIDRTYNDFNEMTVENLGNDLVMQRNYDLAGRCTQLTLPDQSTVAYQFAGVLLKNIQRIDAQKNVRYQHTYEYNAANGKHISSQLIGNVGNIAYGYDEKERCTSIQSEWWSEQINGFHTDSILLTLQDPAGTATQTISYGNNQQIEQENGDFANTYQYDSLHNRIAQNDQTWSINGLNQVIQANEMNYRYDLNGNLIEQTGAGVHIHYGYDALNRLIRVTHHQNRSIEYTYDAFHRRLVQIISTWNEVTQSWDKAETARFLYDGDKEIGKIDANGQLIELRVLGAGKGAEIGAAIAIEINQMIYAPIHDHRGSVRCLIDIQSRSVAEFYRYSVYGKMKIFEANRSQLEQSAVGNHWCFSSKRHDQHTDLIYFGRRYYSPTLGRWTTPDPMAFFDGPNLYAYVHNDPFAHCDLYGLFSVSTVWDTILRSISVGWNYLQNSSNQVWSQLYTELGVSPETASALRKVGKKLVGESFVLLMGYECNDQEEVGVYGSRQINDKVRVTLINGILTTKGMLIENLELVSKTHGGSNIHYILRPTEGWTADLTQAIAIKIAFNLGYRSTKAYLLAETWRTLIQEMGGIEGDGVIVHYAHSLGGSDTDRARDLLTPEEQKMIRVITFGSSTLVRNKGFQSVVNYVSIHDGVSNNIFIEPLGHIRNYFDPHTNIVFINGFFASPFFPLDHLLSGRSYRSIIMDLGEKFLSEFAPD